MIIIPQYKKIFSGREIRLGQQWWKNLPTRCTLDCNGLTMPNLSAGQGDDYLKVRGFNCFKNTYEYIVHIYYYLLC